MLQIRNVIIKDNVITEQQKQIDSMQSGDQNQGKRDHRPAK